MGLGSTYGVLGLRGYGYGVATGGTSSSITVDSVNYTLLEFTSDATLTVSKAGLFDVLVVAGGGAGGGSGNTSVNGGGGAAGGLLQTTMYISSNQTITIGAGGTGSAVELSTAGHGSASRVGTLLSVAGGGGGGAHETAYRLAGNGGSGGGGIGIVNGYMRGLGALGQGFDGGNGNAATASSSGAGGGDWSGITDPALAA
jgi:hypothetical protein